MSLGHFGAVASKLPRPPSSGAGATELLDAAHDQQLPSQEGMPASSNQVMLALRNISHNIVFSSTDADTVSWASGSITLSDGTTYSITGSNTGNMSALTYIYLDIDTSTTALQTTTTYSTAVGSNKYLIAVAQNQTTAASFFVFQGNGAVGGEIIVNANMISNLLITATQIANATITSAKTVVALRNISHNVSFSASDADTVAWGTGTITLSDGTAYSIASGNTGNMAGRTYIYLDPSTSATVLQTTTTASTAVGDGKYLIATATTADTGKLAPFQVFSGIGGVGGQIIVTATQITDAIIIGDLIANATITSGKTKIGLHSVSHNLVFSSSDYDTVAWASGTIVNSAGTSYSISSGNTGNMTNPTYIYLDTDASSTVLQTTTTYSNAVGDNKILIAIAEDAADTGSLAYFQVFDGIGGVSVNAEHIANLSITAALISNLTITAGKIANAQIGTTKMTLADDAAFGSNFLINGSFESFSDGTSSAPNGWTLTGAGATVAKNSTNNDAIGLASVDVTAALNTATDLAQSITVSSSQNTQFRGAAVTFSCKVKASTASRVFLKIDDGIGTTSSSNHTGGGSFETLSVTRTIDASATKVECSLEISSGASITATFDGAMLTFGSTAVEFSPNFNDAFIQPRSLSDTNADTSTSATIENMGSVAIANVTVNGSQSVIAALNVVFSHNTANTRSSFNISRDTTQIGQGANVTADSASKEYSVNITAIDIKPTAGTYTYRARWATDAGTVSSSVKSLAIAIIPSA